MLNCRDCGQPLMQVPGQPRLYFCVVSGLYYVSNRGKLGWPLLTPPGEMIPEHPEAPATATPQPERISADMTEAEMFRHPRFLEFARHQYGELPVEDAMYQLRQADRATKRIVRIDFFNWLQSH